MCIARKLLFALLILVTAGAASAADTWWNKDWTGRSKVRIDTSSTGVETRSPLVGVPVLVRLDVARFDFSKAKPGGQDLRFVAGDDKTPLKYFIEQYDDINELAWIWVQLPQLAPGNADQHIWMYFGNDKIGAAGDDARGTLDSNHVAVFNFVERDGQFRDATSYATALVDNGAVFQPSGWVAAGASFSGKPIVLAASPALALADKGGISVSAWIRPTAAAGTLYRQGTLEVALDGGQLVLRQGAQRLAGGDIRPEAWQHVTMTLAATTATLYLDGRVIGSGEFKAVPVQATVEIGAGYIGDLDVLHLSNAARSADWVLAAALGQSPQAKLVTVEPVEAGSTGDDHSVYFKVLIDNLTLDAWVVIVILMVMLLLSIIVMWVKATSLAKTSRANDVFREKFDALGMDVVQVRHQGSDLAIAQAFEETPDLARNSALYRMYRTAVHELSKRAQGSGSSIVRRGISEQSLASIRASVDATMVRERQRLDSKLVLLTISISGGPFLGLLGTVVGVMIVFAAVAAAGDVNINAIAPGIAAALMATVAGLAVAIPSLFGYNYLASRVKSIAADMQVFADEITTRLAERFAPKEAEQLEAAE